MLLFKKRNSKQSETEKENDMKKQNKKQEEKRIKKLERRIKEAKSADEIYFETEDLCEKSMVLEIMSKDKKFQCIDNGAKLTNCNTIFFLRFTKKEDEDLF